ncbi:isoleucine--tRNA ligase [Nitratifractor salsuginis]|uniref:Isoleucine--tRNA ligase n=1 Tax=Nitratifractor salsuginis (strain DSM 16511 / JCM 12458 / E9I37-1) TaxID=749222 RepID=E6X1G3_NITSE|nr:isoleucine--tRNA ligase [Nitratifractor salsuginis]ADV45896.1 Isoleucyl-tRNA synthetase [Nitratifractor salsuginis DSM 16511]
MDYKETLLLPKTDFPMRGNLPKNEPLRYTKWFEEGAYDRMKANREGRKMFTLHDGPPYANGEIHIGHALNKILKDIIVKHHYFQGEAVRYTPGWDCHGLPIEQKVEERIGKAKKDAMPVSEFRALCREHAAKYIEIQKEGFKSLGVIGDWENPYVTMDFAFEANIYRTLCDVAKKGLLVERNKPVYWSWAAESALADAEVEYKDKEDYSIYVAFELSDKAKEELDIHGKAAVVIWTTTPWTLPANTGIALAPEENYVLTDDGYIVAESRYDALIEEGVVSGHAVRRFSAKELENKLAINPLNGRPSQIILGEHVELDGGTGAVHTAPGHGEDDYFAGLKYGLEVLMPVDDQGRYDESIVGHQLLPEPEKFVGMHIFDANEKILELLGDALLKSSKFTHSYPHCWRTKKPVIYRATKQWFIAVDAKPEGSEETLRGLALKGIKETTFYPDWGRNRLRSMVEGRPDWCISRQRTWGVPIAFFRVKKTKEVILDEKVLNFIAAIFEREGCDAWYDRPIEELLYPGSGYKPEELEKVNDILDVWFDSGSTWNAVLKSRRYDAGEFPADMYLEGSDQHRGWFQSSLLLSSAINFHPPYRSILTHGFTVDENGEKMSKSRGNVVAPQKVTQQFGSEILRLWVALSDYQSDLKISDGILKQTAEQYRKIRNTFRFLLANVNDLKALRPVEELGELDRWILAEAGEVFAEVKGSFDAYEFSRGFSRLNNFLTNELSGIYMDISKDRLYCDAPDAPGRRGAQTAMAMIARSMLALIAPTLTYTADEVLEYAPAVIKGEWNDVFDMEYTPLPELSKPFDDGVLLAAREAFSEAVDWLKKEKVIKATLELAIAGPVEQLPLQNPKDLEDWFVVSAVAPELETEELGSFSVDDLRFTIHRAPAQKCPRCWRYSSTGEEKLCERCAEVMDA